MGKLIIIEGIDGSGKTTQVKMLEELLVAKGKTVKCVKFPNYQSPTGQLVSSYLKNEFGPASELDPRLSCALYALDRAAHKEHLKRYIEKYDYVLLDRYFYSNIALQGAKGHVLYETIRDFVLEMEAVQMDLPLGKVIWLNYNSGESAKERLKGRGEESGTGVALDGHESDEKYMARVASTYELMASELGFSEVKLFEQTGTRKTPVCLANEIERLIESYI